MWDSNVLLTQISHMLLLPSTLSAKYGKWCHTVINRYSLARPNFLSETALNPWMTTWRAQACQYDNLAIRKAWAWPKEQDWQCKKGNNGLALKQVKFVPLCIIKTRRTRKDYPLVPYICSKKFNLAQNEIWPLPSAFGRWFLSPWDTIADKSVFVDLRTLGHIW